MGIFNTEKTQIEIFPDITELLTYTAVNAGDMVTQRIYLATFNYSVYYRRQ